MSKRKPVPVESQEWAVPVSLSYRTHVLVSAVSAEEAKEKVLAGDWEDKTGEGEIYDWTVKGEPQPNR